MTGALRRPTQRTRRAKLPATTRRRPATANVLLSVPSRSRRWPRRRQPPTRLPPSPTPTIEDIIVKEEKEEEEEELAQDNEEEDAPAIAAEALASLPSLAALRFHESAEDEQASTVEKAEEVEPPVEVDEEEDAATVEEEVGPAEEEVEEGERLEVSSPVICSYLSQLFDCK